MLVHLLHDQLHFVKSHSIPTRYLNKNSTGVVKEAALIKKRTLECLFNCLVGTIVAFGKPISEKATGIFGVQCRKQIVHANSDDAGAEDYVHCRTNALTDDLVSGSKGLSYPVLWND